MSQATSSVSDISNSPRGLANSLRGMGAGAQAPLWDALPTVSMPVRLLIGELDTRYREIAARVVASTGARPRAAAPWSGAT